jgi:hypothetical protein
MVNKITFESVLQAVEELNKANICPTVRAVRDKLGRGSLSSIHAFLHIILEADFEIPPESDKNSSHGLSDK